MFGIMREGGSPWGGAAGVSRIVDRPVRVHTLRPGCPVAFRWAGRWHRISAVEDEWVYREPWWEQGLWPEQGPGRARERTFFRVRAEDGGVVELVRRDPEGDWRLYRIYD
jgi:hypothetical protein